MADRPWQRCSFRAPGRRGSPTYPFTGVLDDLRIYNAALSDTEIAQLAAQ